MGPETAALSLAYSVGAGEGCEVAGGKTFGGEGADELGETEGRLWDLGVGVALARCF